MCEAKQKRGNEAEKKNHNLKHAKFTLAIPLPT